MVTAVQSLQTTATTLTASPASSVAGQAITLTAAVAPTSGTSTPTGTITFQDGSTAIGSAPLATGKAVLSVSTLSLGTHSLTAIYSGDAANQASTSSAVPVTITAATTPSPDYGLSLSSSSLAMTQGASGSLTVTVTPENGFNSAITFACSGLPSGWACSFAPATLSGSATQSTKLTVGATNSSQLMPSPTGLLLALVSPMPLIFFRLRGEKSRSARWMLLALFMLLLAGCGTSFQSVPPPQSGTYNVTVTATGASAPTHTQTFVLTMSQ